jgi:isopentenyl-diphosphate Delta-isomerase
MIEYIAVVDENDSVVGKAIYSEILEKKLLHRSANVMVFNSKGEIFVHKRAINLALYPGLYDIKFGGMVDYGESYESAAIRELKEESGIVAKLTFLFAMKTRVGRYNTNREVFSCTYDGKLHLQKEEVESGSFMRLEDAASLNLSPSAREIYKKYMEIK